MSQALGSKGMVSIIPFTTTKGLLFAKTIEEASFIHDLGHVMVKGKYKTLVRRWSPRENF